MDAEPNTTQVLDPLQQEQVYFLVRQALAVTLLIESDEDSEDTTKDAAGAIVLALSKARRIMETGSES